MFYASHFHVFYEPLSVLSTSHFQRLKKYKSANTLMCQSRSWLWIRSCLPSSHKNNFPAVSPSRVPYMDLLQGSTWKDGIRFWPALLANPCNPCLQSSTTSNGCQLLQPVSSVEQYQQRLPAATTRVFSQAISATVARLPAPTTRVFCGAIPATVGSHYNTVVKTGFYNRFL